MDEKRKTTVIIIAIITSLISTFFWMMLFASMTYVNGVISNSKALELPLGTAIFSFCMLVLSTWALLSNEEVEQNV